MGSMRLPLLQSAPHHTGINAFYASRTQECALPIQQTGLLSDASRSSAIASSTRYETPKAVAPKNEHSTITMSYQCKGKKTSLQTWAISNGDEYTGSARNDIPEMGNSQNKAAYFSLRLSRNVLSFFCASRLSGTQTKQDYSQMSEFESLMDVGASLLKEGEQGLDGKLEVGIAARMLKGAGTRFAAASAIDPSSIGAIDAWGTTLLVHGKLKLLLSEKLRDMRSEAGARGSRRGSDLSHIERAIPQVCEECERLLVEAGRKFSMAISMDRGHDFALFNWGLALFYRARLIAADEFEDAAQDADKIYLAAIDKFKATAKVSKEYSGAAFLSWGLALRDQCWLRPSMATEKRIGLMEQARWASEQALQAHPNSAEAKYAVDACSEELELLQSNSNTGQRPQQKRQQQRMADWY